MIFTETRHCKSHAHCRTCLSCTDWRAQIGAPAICPHGITIKTIPEHQKPKPEEWPILARPLKLLAKPDDKGLGDIVARTVGPLGGDAYKAWYKTTFGKSCGCTERQEDWNQKYPL